MYLASYPRAIQHSVKHYIGENTLGVTYVGPFSTSSPSGLQQLPRIVVSIPIRMSNFVFRYLGNLTITLQASHLYNSTLPAPYIISLSIGGPIPTLTVGP